MPDSLLDFGNITKLAQQNLQNAMHMQQLSLQEEQGQRAAQQLKINQQNATTEHINALGNFLKDENVLFDPNLTGAIVNKISNLAGGPSIDMTSLQVGRQAKIDYAKGLQSGDTNKAWDGIVGYAAGAPIDKLDKLIDSMGDYQKKQEELLKLKQDRLEHAEKYEKIQYDNARVNIGRPLYTGLANDFRAQTNIPDRRSFEAMQNLYEKARETGKGISEVLGSKQLPGVNKANLANMLNGKFGEVARGDALKLDALKENTGRLQKMLDDAEHGTPLPSDVTKPMLRAQIEANDVAYGAMMSMKEWHEEPFDKKKYQAAVAAGRTLEDHRLKIEDLDKNTHADTIKIQQETLAFHQKQQQDKDEQASAEAMAKAAYSALPAKRQTPQEAEKIYQSVFEKTGRHVDTDTIMKGAKDVNAPSMKVEFQQEKAFDQELGKENVKDIKDSQAKARDAADIIDTIHQGRKLLDSGMITGVGAEYLTKFGQALSQAGFNEKEDSIANTQAYAAVMANNVGKMIKQFGAGTGLSDADRDYAKKMANGDITISEKAIHGIMDISEKAARNVIARHNKNVKGVKSMIPLEVDPPPAYSFQKPDGKGKVQSGDIATIQSDAEFNKLPSGAIFIGPDGKKRRKP